MKAVLRAVAHMRESMEILRKELQALPVEDENNKESIKRHFRDIESGFLAIDLYFQGVKDGAEKYDYPEDSDMDIGMPIEESDQYDYDEEDGP